MVCGGIVQPGMCSDEQLPGSWTPPGGGASAKEERKNTATRQLQYIQKFTSLFVEDSLTPPKQMGRCANSGAPPATLQTQTLTFTSTHATLPPVTVTQGPACGALRWAWSSAAGLRAGEWVRGVHGQGEARM